MAVSPGNVVIQLKNNGKVIGSQTSFMVSINRQKLPILALGRTDALGYGRGFRVISGIIDYVVINQDMLKEIVDDYGDGLGEYVTGVDEYDVWNEIENSVYGESNNNDDQLGSLTSGSATLYKFNKIKPVTLDMLPPLDIIVYGIDDDGKASGMIIYGLEFTSSSLAVTINDVAIQQRAEWVATKITPWVPMS